MKKRYTPYPEKEFPVGTVIGIIALIIVIIAIASVVSNYSNDFGSSKVKVNTDGSVTVTMTGKEPEGVSTGFTLAPGESVSVKYLSGKIICDNKKGFSYPIWGVPIEKTHPGWIPYMPYAEKGIWTNAVCVILEGTEEETIYSFQENKWRVTAKNIADEPREVILYFHDARGYYDDNEGDAKFLVKKI